MTKSFLLPALSFGLPTINPCPHQALARAKGKDCHYYLVVNKILKKTDHDIWKNTTDSVYLTVDITSRI